MSELINSIVSVILAVAPAIGTAIVSYEMNRSAKTREPIDSPSLNILSIVRHELTLDQWLGIKRATIQRTRFFFILATLLYAGIFLLLTFVLKINQFIIFVAFGSYILILAILLQNYLKNYSLYCPEMRECMNYVIFNDAEMLVEAETHYLFNKCHETLRLMGFNVTTIDEHNFNLKAFQFPTFITLMYIIRHWAPPRIFKIKMEFVEGSTSLYKVSIKCDAGDSHLLESSRSINLFIGRLISQPKNSEEKVTGK